MVASDNLSRPQFAKAIGPGEQLPMFMTPHEIGGMMSGDYGGHVREVPQRMREGYEHQQDKERLRGHTVFSHKLDDVTAAVNDAGGIHSPVRVVHLPSGTAGLYDGHHRAVTALEHGSRLVPVEHYFDSGEVLHDIKHENKDWCAHCETTPTAPVKRSWG